MKNTLLIIFLLFGYSVLGQKVKVDTFHVVLKELEGMEEELMLGDLYFPLVQTGNEQIDRTINADLKKRFFYDQYLAQSLGDALSEWGGTTLADINFAVTYNQNNILSLNVYYMYCDANCITTTEYFNYSTVTGEFLEISDVVDFNDDFKTFVKQDKTKQYAQEKSLLTEKLNDPELSLEPSEIEEQYEYLVGLYEDCENFDNFQRFSIHSDGLEIINGCELPHFIQFFTPEITLKYSMSTIKNFLKVKL